MVTVVRSSSVPDCPSTRTFTVGPASAVAGRSASSVPASAPDDVSFMRANPFSARAVLALWSEGGLLAPGPTPPHLPGPRGGPVVATAAAVAREGHPRTQWRV